MSRVWAVFKEDPTSPEFAMQMAEEIEGIQVKLLDSLF